MKKFMRNNKYEFLLTLLTRDEGLTHNSLTANPDRNAEFLKRSTKWLRGS